MIFDLLIIGAGPAGLACAIEAKKNNLSTVLLDKGNVVHSIQRFPINQTFFSTPELLEIGGIPFVIPNFRPSRLDCVKYYHKVASHFQLNVQSYEEVTSIQKRDTYQVHSASGKTFQANNVVVATGYFDTPNTLNVEGENLPKVIYHYGEPFEYAGKRVAIVGGKNTAAENALDLFRAGANVTIIHRGETMNERIKYWILPDLENRIKEGSINALFNSTVKKIAKDSIEVQTNGTTKELANDFVIICIGYHPDNTLLHNAGVTINEETYEPLCNPDTLETNIPNLFVAGSSVAGKFNNKIFIENGREHGKKIIAAILQKH